MLLRLILSSILLIHMTYALASPDISTGQINKTIRILSQRQKTYTKNLANLNDELADAQLQQQSAKESGGKLLISLEQNLPLTHQAMSLLNHESNYTNNAIAKHNLANLLVQSNQRIRTLDSNINQLEQNIKRTTLELAIVNQQLAHQRALKQQQIDAARELLSDN